MSAIPSLVRTVGDSFRLEVGDDQEVTLVIVPIDVRAIIPRDVFCRFASAVADVLGHLTAAPTRAERRTKQ